MSARIPTVTVVTPTRCVPTPKDLTSVDVLEGTKEMVASAQVNLLIPSLRTVLTFVRAHTICGSRNALLHTTHTLGLTLTYQLRYYVSTVLELSSEGFSFLRHR